MMGKYWIILVLFSILIAGCGGITGNVVEGISREEAETIAVQQLREIQGSYRNIVYNVENIGNYWVVQSIGIDTRFIWVNIHTGDVECVTKNSDQPIDCF